MVYWIFFRSNTCISLICCNLVFLKILFILILDLKILIFYSVFLFLKKARTSVYNWNWVLKYPQSFNVFPLKHYQEECLACQIGEFLALFLPITGLFSTFPPTTQKKQSVKEDTGWSTRPGYWRWPEQFLFPLHTRFLFKFPASTTEAAVPAAPRRFPRAEIKVKQHQLLVTSRLLVTNCNGLLQHKQLSYPFPGERTSWSRK